MAQKITQSGALKVRPSQVEPPFRGTPAQDRYDPDFAEFDRKLRACNPHRQFVRSLVGTVVVIAAVGIALYVALSPQARYRPNQASGEWHER